MRNTSDITLEVEKLRKFVFERLGNGRFLGFWPVFHSIQLKGFAFSAVGKL